MQNQEDLNTKLGVDYKRPSETLFQTVFTVSFGRFPALAPGNALPPGLF